jgi:chromosome segregation ATPase
VSLAEKLLEELKSSERVREEFLAFVAEGVARDRRARLVLLQGLLREAATKSDVESAKAELRVEIDKVRTELKAEIDALRKEFKADVESLRREFRGEVEALRSEVREEVKSLEARIESLEARISSFEQRVARLEGSINLFIKLFIAFNLPLLVSVIAALVALLLRAR